MSLTVDTVAARTVSPFDSAYSFIALICVSELISLEEYTVPMTFAFG